jgi:hypothetical protein
MWQNGFMRILWSTSAEAILEALEVSDENRYDAVVMDLDMLSFTSVQDTNTWAEFGTYQYLVGPTGQVRYWVGLVEDDCIVVEYFDVD